MYAGQTQYVLIAGPMAAFEGSEPDNRDQYYIPGRTIFCARPEVDLVVLPLGSRELDAFVSFAICYLGYKDWQFIWTPNDQYLLERGVLANWGDFNERVQRGLIRSRKMVIVPYSATTEIFTIADRLGAQVMGEAPSFAGRWGRKSIFHPNLSNSSSLGHCVEVGAIPGITVPRGYAVANQDELMRAIAQLEAVGVESFIIKADFGAGGDGIFPNLTKDSIPPHLEYPLVVQEMLSLAEDELGPIALSVQYEGNGGGKRSKPKGTRIWRQIIDGSSYAGSMIASGLSEHVQTKISSMTARLIDNLSPKGCGGFDFLLTEDGEVYLVDLNPRMTGAHPIHWLLQSFGREEDQFLAWKVAPRCGVEDAWLKLCRAGIALSRGSEELSGVLPILHMQGVWNMYLAVGPDMATVMRLRERVNELIC